VSTAHVKVNVVTRVRVSSDPRRKARANLRWYVLVLLAFAGCQTAYQAWAYRSDVAVTPVFRASESCHTLSADSAQSSVAGACRREFAIVVELRSSSGRSGTTYRIRTVSSDGTRESAALAGPNARTFFHRVRPTERIALQRFVAPGYSLTGSVTAFADSAGSVETFNHPEAGARYHAVLAIMGLILFVLGGSVYWMNVKGFAQRAATI
jgi:hypothetical protein